MKRRNFLLAGAALLLLGGGFTWNIFRKFGDLPKQDPISPHWRHGEFHNLPNAYVYPDLSKERAFSGGWLNFFLARDNDRYPGEPVASVHSDLRSLRDGQFVWLGHSSLLLKLASKIICIDPVLSSYASPVPFIIPAWPGSNPYTVSDFPVIDYLCISHDHWDHLDYTAITSLKFKHLLCGKGTGAHFHYWGIRPEPIELDWFEEWRDGDLRFIYTPSQHFSGRGTTRNKSHWGGFIMDAGSGGKIYFSGDGGFGCHFRDIGQKYGPMDLFFPDCGQYNRSWSSVHMFPEQSAQAGLDVRARLVCPVHMGKFTLAMHPWNEPSYRFSKKAAEMNLPYLLPVIGEIKAI